MDQVVGTSQAFTTIKLSSLHLHMQAHLVRPFLSIRNAKLHVTQIEFVHKFVFPNKKSLYFERSFAKLMKRSHCASAVRMLQ